VYISKRLLLAALVALVGGSSLAFALSASAHRAADPNESAGLLRSSLAPSMTTDPTIHSVGPGTLPWALADGSVRLRDNGRFRLEVEGLVITSGTFIGTPGPVTGIVASVFCGADSNSIAAATTGIVPLSRGGDASIDTTLSLPSTCLAPIVFVNPVLNSAPTATTSRYIALTGFRP
jgi:hypothetical protein